MDGTVRVKSLVWFATGVVVTLLATVIVMQTWRADAAPGDVDTTFVPITPGCRFADTRQPGQGGPIGPGQTRQFTVHGVHNDCTIPTGAVAVLMNVTADRQTASNSFLSIWGNGANPGTSALNPAAGEPPTPNAVTTDLTGAGVFNVYNDAGSVDLIIDINGYYTRTSLQEIDQRLDALELAQPFAVSASTTGRVELAPVSQRIVSVQVEAPVAGSVVVDSGADVGHTGPSGSDVLCGIENDDVVAMSQQFERDDNSDNGNISDTQRFDIAAGAIETFTLVCIEVNNGGYLESGSGLTAIFVRAER